MERHYLVISDGRVEGTSVLQEQILHIGNKMLK